MLMYYVYAFTVSVARLDLRDEVAVLAAEGHLLRDNNSYTTTNKRLPCLIKIMYTVF